MKIAAIDLGTNSIRLLKGVIDSGVLKVGDKKIASTRLGRGIGSKANTGSVKKVLPKEAMVRTVEVLKTWADELSAWGADEVSVIATSAVRDADNRDEFVDMVSTKAGFDVEVISGKEEAQLGFGGVMMGVETSDLCMIIDVGGGSTELIVGDSKSGIYYVESLDIGAVRMSEKFAVSGNEGKLERNALAEYIDSELCGYAERFDVAQGEGEANGDCDMEDGCEAGDRVANACEKFNEHAEGISVCEKNNENVEGISYCEKNNERSATIGVSKLIGIGGTATTFSAIDLQMVGYDRKLIQGYNLSERRFGEILDMLSGMNVEQRREVAGLQPERADIITAGGQIIYSSIRKFGFEGITTSDFDNLEGIFASKYSEKFSKVIVDAKL